jgi:outer membrane protein assembly factor BamB
MINKLLEQRFVTSKFLAALVVLFHLGGGGVIDASGATASEVLNASGVKGGLVVHIGSSDGQLETDIAKSGFFLVQGLAVDAQSLETARNFIRTAGFYGEASVDLLKAEATTLPYSNNLVNLVVVSRLPNNAIPLKDIWRVVATGGSLLLPAGQFPQDRVKSELGADKTAELSAGGPWIRVKRTRAAEMDEWTHIEHDAARSMTTQDKMLGSPTGLRWVAGPLWPRTSRKGLYPNNIGIASAGGRNYFITSNEAANLTAKYQHVPYWLIARDAWNGIKIWSRLWKGPRQNSKEKPMTYQRGPVALVVTADRVYTSEGNDVVEIDAATGQTLHTLTFDSPCDTLALLNDRLVAATIHNVYGIDTASFKQVWQAKAVAVNMILGDGKVFFVDAVKDPYDAVCLDLPTGKQLWKTTCEEWKNKKPATVAAATTTPQNPPDGATGGKAGKKGKKKKGDTGGSEAGAEEEEGMDEVPTGEESGGKSPTQTFGIRGIHRGVLIGSLAPGLAGVDINTGNVLWRYTVRQTPGGDSALYHPVFLMNDLLWFPLVESRNWGEWVGVDPKTGIEKKRNQPNQTANSCGRMPATPNQLIFTKRHEFYDLESGDSKRYSGARGACTVGMMPANGLMYTFVHGCACNGGAIRGNLALSVEKDPLPAWSKETNRLYKGPSYGKAGTASANTASDWPMLRRDPARSGSTGNGPTKLNKLWELMVEAPSSAPLYSDWQTDTSLGDPITPPVISGGTIYISVRDRHQVRALESSSGKLKWSFTAGARVDNPPTISKGWCIFGSRDGYVYCLNADTGELAWKYEAAPLDRRIVAFGQVESAWPVPGSVLVDETGTAFFSAGRSPRSDGGLFLYAVDLATGAVKWKVLPAKAGGNPEKMGHGYTPLIDAGSSIGIGSFAFDKKDGSIENNPAPHMTGSQMGIADGSWRRLNSPLRKSQHSWTLGGKAGGKTARGIIIAFSKVFMRLPRTRLYRRSR